MSRFSAIAIATLLALGCQKEEPAASSVSASAAAPAVPTSVAPAPAPAAPASAEPPASQEPVVDQEHLPAKADFEEQAEQDITEKNFVSELAKIEKAIGKE